VNVGAAAHVAALKNGNVMLGKRGVIVLVFVSAFIAATAIAFVGSGFIANPEQHIIKFGGRKYTPSSLTVHVGDDIVWQGDFSEHSLTLTSAPSGATKFSHITTGTSYTYHVQVAGGYKYQCDDHVDDGMVGSFTAVQ
jgi:plastocyanin